MTEKISYTKETLGTYFQSSTQITQNRHTDTSSNQQ